MLDNLIWHALHTQHARFAQSAPLACKYPAEMAPFAATLDNSPESLLQLHQLLTPGETVYLLYGAPPPIPQLMPGETIPCLQMTAPLAPLITPTRTPKDRHPHLKPTPLHASDAAAICTLTTLASPGFFRSRTQQMGRYYGIHIDGELVAMAGERLAIPNAREISGVCTHPAHTGQGHAAKLITYLSNLHAQVGLHSFLHVASANARALALYLSLGFAIRREVILYPLTRPNSSPV